MFNLKNAPDTVFLFLVVLGVGGLIAAALLIVETLFFIMVK